MISEKCPLIIWSCLLILCSFSFAAPNKPQLVHDPNTDDVNRTEPKFFVSEEQTKFYQKTNALLFATLLDPKSLNGPHAGPGYVSAIDGPLFEITWMGKEEDPNNLAKRLVPFSSIISIDRPLTGLNLEKLWVVYYKAPSGITESSFLIQGGDFFDSFKKRWKSYLLSQEKGS